MIRDICLSKCKVIRNDFPNFSKDILKMLLNWFEYSVIAINVRKSTYLPTYISYKTFNFQNCNTSVGFFASLLIVKTGNRYNECWTVYSYIVYIVMVYEFNRMKTCYLKTIWCCSSKRVFSTQIKCDLQFFNYWHNFTLSHCFKK